MLNNINLVFWFYNNLTNFFILIIFCFLQISLNFLTIFSISQPYLMIIILFILLRKSKNPPPILMLVFVGLFYDFLTGTHIGIHPLFFATILNFSNLLERQFQISKNYGDWILFAIVYFVSLVLTKLVFMLFTFEMPDLNSICFNMGTTILIYPLIKFLSEIPKMIVDLINN